MDHGRREQFPQSQTHWMIPPTSGAGITPTDHCGTLADPADSMQRSMTMRIAKSLLVCSALAAAGCQADHTADAVTRDDRAVLEALEKTACKLGEREVVSDTPVLPAQPSAHFGLDLRSRPMRVARWPRQAVCKTVTVEPESQISRAFAADHHVPPTWEAFGASFGGAQHLLRLSLPAYSKDGRQAVVYTERTCAIVCGASFYHELRKTDVGWVITRSEPASIS
jgi:hypothetical protein